MHANVFLSYSGLSRGRTGRRGGGEWMEKGNAGCNSVMQLTSGPTNEVVV